MSTAIRVPEALQAAPVASSTPPRRESGAAESGAVSVGAVSSDAVSSDATAFDRLAFRDAPLAILAAAAVLAMVAGPAWTAAAGPWIWIVSLVFVGLPHGATDFVVGRALAGRSVRELAFGSLLYVTGMVCIAGLFALAPVATILLFSLMSIWHFGVGHRDTEPEGTEPENSGEAGVAGPTWLAEAACAMARAGVVLGMPAVAWPGQTADVANRLVSLLNPRVATHGLFFDPPTVFAAGCGLLAASVAAIVGEAIARRGRGMGWLLIELGVFAAFGWCASPLFFVGLYYLCWHAWRHLRAVMPATDPRSLAGSIFRLHLQGLPLLVPTLAVLGGLWWLLSPGHSPRDLAILSIGVYLIVTPSHDVLVRRFRDRRVQDDIR